eukprot:g20833.t1
MGVLDTGVGPPRSGEQDTWGLPGCPQLKNAYDELKKRGENMEMLALEDAAGGGAAPAPQPAKMNPASKSTCASASSSRNTTPAMKKMNMKSSSKESGSAVESALSSQQEPLGDVEMRDAAGSEDRREDHHQRRRVTFDKSVVDHEQAEQVLPGAASSLDLGQRITEKNAADQVCAADMLRDVTSPNPTFPTALQFVQKVKENFEEKLSLKVLVDEKDLHN